MRESGPRRRALARGLRNRSPLIVLVALLLAVAALATAAGFLSFAPTAYLGVRDLGLIAGAGMIIAFLLNLTLLPALLSLLRAGALRPDAAATEYVVRTADGATLAIVQAANPALRPGAAVTVLREERATLAAR